MNISGNTILITGGGSGIGRGLAEALAEAGNQVVIAGRRQESLEEAASGRPNISTLTLDIEDPQSIRSFADQVVQRHPALNVVVHNAGIMRPEDLTAEEPGLADADAIIQTNLLGPIRLTAALLPHLKKQPNPTIITVSSGLAFVPLAATPTYCATKAAIHSYTQSLRHQLKGAGVEVIELIPPYVGTELMSGGTNDPRAMPLPDFISEVMSILRSQPQAAEICVERVKPLRFAAEQGRFAEVFTNLNAH